MSNDEELFRSRFSRRRFLTVAGSASAGIAAAPLLSGAPSAAAAENRPDLSSPGDPVSTPRVNGLHLQLGPDASSEIVVSWHTLQRVRSPRALLGEADGRFLRSVAADEVTYTDAKSGLVVYAYHARVERLSPSHEYVYAAVHAGAEPEFGSFQTGPRGRAAGVRASRDSA